MGSWHRELAARHEADERWDRAIRCYLTALDQDPADLETYYRLAGLYARLGKAHRDLDLLEQAGKVGRAGRRRSADQPEWHEKFDRLLGELQTAWEAAGGVFEEAQEDD